MADPEKDSYEGRFYQYLSPFPEPEEELASLPVTGIDDKIAFRTSACIAVLSWKGRTDAFMQGRM